MSGDNLGTNRSKPVSIARQRSPGSVPFVLLLWALAVFGWEVRQSTAETFVWQGTCGTGGWSDSCGCGVCVLGGESVGRSCNNWGRSACAELPSYPGSGDSVYVSGSAVQAVNINVSLQHLEVGTGGTLNVTGRLETGTLSVSSGATLWILDGYFSVLGASSPQGLVQASILRVDPSGATLEFDGAGFHWSADSEGTGVLTNAAEGLLWIDDVLGNGNFKLPLFANRGTVSHTRQRNMFALMTPGAAIHNEGVYDLQGTGFFGLGGLNSFENLPGALFKKTGSASSLVVDMAFHNRGTLEIHSGSLGFENGLQSSVFTQYAGKTRLFGATITADNPMDFSGGMLEGGGTITANVNNSGAVVLAGFDDGTTERLTIQGTYTQSDAAAILGLVNGSTFDANMAIIQAGSVVGAGVVNSDLNLGGAISPGDPGPTLGQIAANGFVNRGIGEITVNAQLNMLSTGVFRVDLAGGDPLSCDHILVNGHANLGGTLEINVIPGDPLHVGDQFRIIDCKSRFGGFPAVVPEGYFAVIYDDTGVTVTILAIPPPFCTPPTVTSITPEAGVQGRSNVRNHPPYDGVTIPSDQPVHATITGTNFAAGATVKLVQAGHGDLDATNVSVVNSTTITADISFGGLTDNPAGLFDGVWDVVVTTCEAGTLSGGFTVGTCFAPETDADGDGDVDLADFLTFQACFNGPNRPYKLVADIRCRCFDSEPDTDVDLSDFMIFQDCFNGPNRSPKC